MNMKTKKKKLYKHKSPRYHETLGFGVLSRIISNDQLEIHWININAAIVMHVDWLEEIHESG